MKKGPMITIPYKSKQIAESSIYAFTVLLTIPDRLVGL